MCSVLVILTQSSGTGSAVSTEIGIKKLGADSNCFEVQDTHLLAGKLGSGNWGQIPIVLNWSAH
jgi:hypothetical protein